MPFADLSSARLFYTDDGVGDPPLLLVHGWACDSHDWSWQYDALTRNHRVVAPDNRGHGRSSVPVDGYTPKVFAADLAELLRTLGVAPCVAVGHSLGGIIVSALAVEHPELVRAVVVVDPAYGAADANVTLIEGILDGLRSPMGYETASAAFAGMEGADTPAALRVWHRRRVLGTPLGVVIDTVAGIYEPEDQIGLRAASEAYLARRLCPVLAVYADADRAAWDATTHTHVYSQAIAWEGCGHWLHQERPATFNDLVLDWVAGLPSN